MRAFYNGCYMHLGHYLHRVGYRSVHEGDPCLEGVPWHPYQLDGVLCPGVSGFRGHHIFPHRQIEGEALLHHRDGWTALAFWDRSVDTRHNSNSVFLLEGAYDFDTAVRLTREVFPEVWARFTFEVKQSPDSGAKP